MYKYWIYILNDVQQQSNVQCSHAERFKFRAVKSYIAKRENDIISNQYVILWIKPTSKITTTNHCNKNSHSVAWEYEICSHFFFCFPRAPSIEKQKGLLLPSELCWMLVLWTCKVRCLHVVFLFCISYLIFAWLPLLIWIEGLTGKQLTFTPSLSHTHKHIHSLSLLLARKDSILLSEFIWQTVANKMLSLPSYQFPY